MPGSANLALSEMAGDADAASKGAAAGGSGETDEALRAALGKLVRSKGFMWLAFSDKAAMYWSHAGELTTPYVLLLMETAIAVRSTLKDFSRGQWRNRSVAVCFWDLVCCSIVGCRVDKRERTQAVRFSYPPPPPPQPPPPARPPLSVSTNVVSIGRHSDLALRL